MNRHHSPNELPIDEEAVARLFPASSDIKVIKLTLPQEGREDTTVLLVFCEGLCDGSGINKIVIPDLKRMAERRVIAGAADLEKFAPFYMVPIPTDRLEEEITAKVLIGDLVLIFGNPDRAYVLQWASPPQRSPDEPNTEVSTRGPKDGFTEETHINIALIRKRLKTSKLAVEEFTLGDETVTKVNLLYLQGVMDENVLHEIQTRLRQIRIEALVSSIQLEELLTGFSILPLFSYTGRPDFAVNALLNGRFILLVEGSPTAISAPVNFSFLLNTAEDAHSFNVFVMFIRMLRLSGILISVFMPGFFIALVSFHQDQIPFTLLATLVNARQGIPFPIALEALVMLILFEIFREAGMRLPSAFGQTLSVVGGLIIGESAIRAGIAAPGTTIVIAISVLSTFTLVNQSLVGAVSLVRIFVLLFASFLGLFGVLICLLSVVLYMVNLRSFGTYYMFPLSPPKLRDMYKVVFRMPWGKKS